MRRAALTLLCAAALLASAAAPATAQQGHPAKALHAVQLQHRDDATLLVLKTDGDATFSAYRIEGPPRLFVDLSNITLGSSVKLGSLLQQGPLAGRVTLSEVSDPLQQLVRLVVTLDGAQQYDVHTDGGNIVVALVSGAPQAASRGGGSAEELELARQALLQKERRLRELEEQLQQATTGRPPSANAALEREQARLKDEVHTLKRRADDAERQVEALKRQSAAAPDPAPLQRELAEQRRRTDAAAAELKTARVDLEKRDKELQSRDKRMEGLDAEVATLQQRERERAARLTQAERERADLLRQQEQRAAELAATRDQLLALQRRSDEDAKALRAAREQLQRPVAAPPGAADPRVATLTDENRRANARLTELQQEIERLQRDLQQARQDSAVAASARKTDDALRQERERADHLRAELDTTQKQLRAATTRADDLQRQRDEAQRGSTAVARLEEDLQRNRRDLAEAQRRGDDLQRELARAQREAETLRGELSARLVARNDAPDPTATTLAVAEPLPEPRRPAAPPPTRPPTPSAVDPMARNTCADKPDGAVTLYHSNFRKKEVGTCKRGYRHGDWVFWDEAGAVLWQGTFEHGTPVTSMP